MISNGQLVDEAVTNSAFISKTDTTSSNTASGVVRLNNTTDSESGAQIDNVQKKINDANFLEVGNEAISGSGTITLNTHGNQFRHVVGNGGPQTTDTAPFGSGAFEGGLIVRVIGTSDTDTVTIPHSDTVKGCILNGTARLKRYYILELQYSSILSRFIEIGRNW
jgi:hypothetical protein